MDYGLCFGFCFFLIVLMIFFFEDDLVRPWIPVYGAIVFFFKSYNLESSWSLGDTDCQCEWCRKKNYACSKPFNTNLTLQNIFFLSFFLPFITLPTSLLTFNLSCLSACSIFPLSPSWLSDLGSIDFPPIDSAKLELTGKWAPCPAGSEQSVGLMNLATAAAMHTRGRCIWIQSIIGHIQPMISEAAQIANQ